MITYMRNAASMPAILKLLENHKLKLKKYRFPKK